MKATSKWHKFLGLPKWSLEIVSTGLSELWTAITLDCRVRSRQGLNQSYSPHWDLSNTMLHTQIGCQEEVDSWLLVVGSQIVNLTPSPSFAHNLGCDVQMANARPFSIFTFQDLSNDTKNTPMWGVLGLVVELRTFESPEGFQIPNFSKWWASPPHLAKVELQQKYYSITKFK
jgi:hypothetical protein